MLSLITQHRIGGAGAGTMQVITEIGSAAEIPQQQLEQLTHFLPRYPDIQIGATRQPHSHLHSTQHQPQLQHQLQAPATHGLNVALCQLFRPNPSRY